MTHQIPWLFPSAMKLYEAGELRQTLGLEQEYFREHLKFKPLFSLLTPLWNTPPQFLIELIESCLHQSYQSWELILVDNASVQKDHLVVVRNYQQKDPRIRFVSTEQNLGISGGRNIAIANACGQYLGVLDHDDLLHPQILGIFAQVLQSKNPPNFLFCNEVKISQNSNKLSDYFFKGRFDYLTLLRTNYIAHFTLIERELLLGVAAPEDSTQIFNPRFDGAEDHDLFLRLAKSPQFHPLHLPYIGYYWRKSPGSTAQAVGEKPLAAHRGKEVVENHLNKSNTRPSGLSVSLSKSETKNKFLTLDIQNDRSDIFHIKVVVSIDKDYQQTLNCLQSIDQLMSPNPLECFIIPSHKNDSKDLEEDTILEKWLKMPRKNIFRLLPRQHLLGNFVQHLAPQNPAADQLEVILFLQSSSIISDPSFFYKSCCNFALDPKLGFINFRHQSLGSPKVVWGDTIPMAIDGDVVIKSRVGDEHFIFDQRLSLLPDHGCCLVNQHQLNKIIPLFSMDIPVIHEEFFFVLLGLKFFQQQIFGFYQGNLPVLSAREQAPHLCLSPIECLWLMKQGFFESLNLIKRQALNLRPLNLETDNLSGEGGRDIRDLPLRYQIADRLNDKIKSSFTPVHKVIKGLLK